MPKSHPTFSQALSGLVKSLRIRRVRDAIYWLLYLDGFGNEKKERYRMARRLLIGSAEDGLSIDVMEKVLENFSHLTKDETSVLELAAEAIRICKIPNWWHPATGGPDYIYTGMVGERELWQFRGDRSVKNMTRLTGLSTPTRAFECTIAELVRERRYLSHLDEACRSVIRMAI